MSINFKGVSPYNETATEGPGQGERGFSPMLAAPDWRDVRVQDGNLSRLGAQAPRPVFNAAYKELCTRIWIELELLAQAESCPPQDLAMSTAILRLELVVLVDSCRSLQWRRMLSAEQRDSLCAMLTDVLAALYVDADQLHAGVAVAQDRVLDELLPESEAGPASTHELVSFVQAQAVARRAAAI